MKLCYCKASHDFPITSIYLFILDNISDKNYFVFYVRHFQKILSLCYAYFWCSFDNLQCNVFIYSWSCIHLHNNFCHPLCSQSIMHLKWRLHCTVNIYFHLAILIFFSYFYFYTDLVVLLLPFTSKFVSLSKIFFLL